VTNQQQHFDQVAGSYDETFPAHVAEHYLRKRAVVIGTLLDGGEGLDVGCGTGLLLAALRRYGTVVGVDPSPGMLEVLARECRGEAVLGSANKLPFADGRFDVVFSVAVLHHLSDPGVVATALREMVRVVRPGGRIVVWDHNPLNPYWPLLMKRSPQDRGDERIVPLGELERDLTNVGAIIVRSFRSGLVPDFTPRIMMPVARAVEWLIERMPLLRCFCAHNVIIAEKE
jgi:ubiquinone/menaquinone biosynthesis C-methylase UbiE